MTEQEPIEVRLGTQIRALREMRGIANQAELGQAVAEVLRRTKPDANVSRSEVQRWESGEEPPTVAELVALGEVLGVSMSGLFPGGKTSPLADGVELAADRLERVVDELRDHAKDLRVNAPEARAPAPTEPTPPEGEARTGSKG